MKKPTHYETPEEREARYVTEEGQSYFTDAEGKPLTPNTPPATLDNAGQPLDPTVAPNPRRVP